ncbi:MAG: DUF3047 domain-containing protein [Betaproteobacteria bacterium]|nr:MAG: DUF3047 domain-containing protein [Betaproteobacteria bacterium]
MKHTLVVALVCSLTIGSVNGTHTKQIDDVQRLLAADFSNLRPGDGLPDEWELITISRIPRHTQYTLTDVDGSTVLQAEAKASMSSLAREIDVDPNATPWLQWRWKIAQLNGQSDLYSKQGDDFPARVYVLFDYDIMLLPFFERIIMRIARAIYGDRLPLAALCYVWAPEDLPDTTAWNAYTNRVRMVVATSGADEVGQWVAVERNVRSDYMMAFGEPVPRITGIALATDTDNTGERSLAWYGDIVFADQTQQQL